MYLFKKEKLHHQQYYNLAKSAAKFSSHLNMLSDPYVADRLSPVWLLHLGEVHNNKNEIPFVVHLIN